MGGEYGDAALELMITIMRRYKAAPSFSKHTGGTAVDFMTVEDGVRLTANSGQQAPWKRMWLHKWLDENAGRFKFNPLHTEARHWEYRR
jgi:LAS superfamily LD-carboxypeptidase LdcB